MAVKGKKCQDIKSEDWISSSFLDSFGPMITDNNEDINSPVSKKARIGASDDSLDDFIPIKLDNNFNNVKSLKVWSEKYEPKRFDDLVLNKKKISELENWLKDVFKSSNSFHKSKILLITGPTGCGKTCALKVLCKSLNINIIEWATPIDVNYKNDDDDDVRNNFHQHYKPVNILFDEFILQAIKYNSLLTTDYENNNKKIVLIKDFPNTFLNKCELFHEIIKKYYCNHYENYISPIVFIISDNNIVRDLFPDDIRYNLNVSNINFNPVTVSNINKALNNILNCELKLDKSCTQFITSNDINDIAESSDGDLRSAILKLQFNTSNNSNKIFKKPKLLNNERIKVVKIPTSKRNANSKHKIYEIDKDKKLDFFSSIGRVLYPKKELIDDNLKFIHSPDTIVELFVTEPNKSINSLHENYLERFTNIKDVSNAALSLSISDLLISSFWEAKDVMVQYGLSTTVRGLMTTNSLPAPSSFKPISKSRIWTTENNRKENLNSVRKIFPDYQSEKDILLDFIPYLNKLKINLTSEQNNIISKIAQYKQ